MLAGWRGIRWALSTPMPGRERLYYLIKFATGHEEGGELPAWLWAIRRRLVRS